MHLQRGVEAGRLAFRGQGEGAADFLRGVLAAPQVLFYLPHYVLFPLRDVLLHGQQPVRHDEGDGGGGIVPSRALLQDGGHQLLVGSVGAVVDEYGSAEGSLHGLLPVLLTRPSLSDRFREQVTQQCADAFCIFCHSLPALGGENQLVGIFVQFHCGTHFWGVKHVVCLPFLYESPCVYLRTKKVVILQN